MARRLSVLVIHHVCGVVSPAEEPQVLSHMYALIITHGSTVLNPH